MKINRFATISWGLILLIMSVGASATMMQSEVGSIDMLVPHANNPADLPNSGDATELAWINSILEPDVAYDSKLGSGEYTFELCMDCGDPTHEVYAFLFDLTNPEYFMIKVGAKPGDDSHYLFENKDSLSWGVVDITALGIKNISKFSHIGEFNPSTEVPEPGVLGLLGLGLIGLIVAHRRKTA